MSNTQDELRKASEQLKQAQVALSTATTSFVTQLALLTVMRSEEANDVKLRCLKAVVRGTRSYAAGLVHITDQVGAEIKELNNG